MASFISFSTFQPTNQGWIVKGFRQVANYNQQDITFWERVSVKNNRRSSLWFWNVTKKRHLQETPLIHVILEFLAISVARGRYSSPEQRPQLFAMD